MRKVQDRKWEQLLWKLDREHRLSAGEWKDLLEAESREAGGTQSELPPASSKPQARTRAVC